MSEKAAKATSTKRKRSLPLPASVLGLLCKQQVCDALGGCSARKLDQMVAAGEFPRADARLGRNPRWSVVLLNKWVENHRD